jgi:uncharacterized protein (DUF1330 family)
MPKAFAVVTYRSVSDPEKLASYAKLALPAVLPFGARVLARGDAVVAREQGAEASNLLRERFVVAYSLGNQALRRFWSYTSPQFQFGNIVMVVYLWRRLRLRPCGFATPLMGQS